MRFSKFIKSLILRVLISIFYKNRNLKTRYALLQEETSLVNDAFARKHGIVEIAYQLGHVKNPELTKEFIRHRFNNIAKKYDNVVNDTHYNYKELNISISILNHLISQLPISKIKVLDLGCGTGLVGRNLKSNKIELVGVDLSEEMLELCKLLPNYSNVFKSDICDYLKNTQDKYNLITACSVIQFFTPSKLEELIALCKTALLDEGCFLFTFDVCNNNDFSINQKLFGEHSMTLIEKTGTKYFKYVKCYPIKINRIESGKVVEGGLAVFSQYPIISHRYIEDNFLN